MGLTKAVPRCASCDNPLLSFMQARCMDCNALVCRSSRECRLQHGAKHAQVIADQAAQAMATRRLSERALHKLKKRDRKVRLSGRPVAVDPIFGGVPLTQHDSDCWNSFNGTTGIPPAAETTTVPFKEADDAVY